MSDKLRECPACCCVQCFVESERTTRTVDTGRSYFVQCDACMMTGPWEETKEAATSKWNLLPRGPVWTEYDGTPETLPPEGVPVLLNHNKKTQFKHRCAVRLNELGDGPGDAIWNPVPGPGGDFVKVGDKWMPWPEAQGGE